MDADDIPEFEKQMRRKVHYVIQPAHLWNSIANLAPTQNAELLNTVLAEFSTDIDARGDAYEYLIGQFAAGSGKKAGEPNRGHGTGDAGGDRSGVAVRRVRG
jgi:type I restriction enzyme M protein